MRRILLQIVMLGVLPALLPAQGRPVELGAGIGGLTLQFSGGETVFNFEVTEQLLAAGFFVSDRVAIEPLLSASVTTTEDVSLVIIGAGLGLPLYLRPTTGKSGLFFHPLATVTIFSADVAGFGESEVQFSAGLGLGTKIPLAERASLRFEGLFRYAFETDVFDDFVNLGALLGISVFLGG